MYGIVFVVGLMGNTLVIYVVLRYTKMQTVTNLYILNLAVADEFFLIGIPFLMVTSGLGFWPFGTIMCKVSATLLCNVRQIVPEISETSSNSGNLYLLINFISTPKLRLKAYLQVSSENSAAVAMFMR